jgi:tetratricopeptide (TPR) repeat protein
MLTERDRAVGHGLAGAFLEGSGERDARVIAEHFERGGEAARAIRWYHRAAQQALAANDLGAAVAWVERGLALGAEGEVRGELRRVEAEARRWRGEFTKLAEAAREALALLPRGSTGALDALGEAAAAASKLGDVERIRTMARELADLRASLPVTSSLVTAEGRLATYLLFAGLRDDASPMLTLAEQDLATLGRDDLVTVSRIELARAIRSLYEGDLAAALTMMEHSSALLRECGDLRGAAVQGVNVSAVWLDAGGYEQALERLQSVLAIAERLALDNVAGFARAHIAVALGGLGRLDEAIAAAREASARLGSQRDGRLAAGAFATLAMLLCDAKAFDEAERVARQSIEVAGPHPSRIRSLGTLGAVLVASGRVAEALEPARESYTRLLEVGSIDDGESLVRLTYAQALDALGDRAAARDVIATAHARLLERASKIQDPSIRNSMLRRVRENAQIADLAKAWGVATFAG